MALVFSGSAEILCWLTICPKNFTLIWPNEHFSRLSVTPASTILFSTAVNRWLRSSFDLLCTSTSSMGQTVPGSPLRIWDILRWEISGALVIPNGNLLNSYLPMGMMKVVIHLDCFAKGICQNHYWHPTWWRCWLQQVGQVFCPLLVRDRPLAAHVYLRARLRVSDRHKF